MYLLSHIFFKNHPVPPLATKVAKAAAGSLGNGKVEGWERTRSI